jgi:hypothetical protein
VTGEAAASSSRSQQVIVAGLARAIEQYFAQGTRRDTAVAKRWLGA